MLMGLLNAIKSRPLANLDQLGAQLNVSTRLIEEMVADLSKRGYLKSFSECESACAHCAIGSACSGANRPRVWLLTEKGQRMTQKHQSQT